MALMGTLLCALNVSIFINHVSDIQFFRKTDCTLQAQKTLSIHTGFEVLTRVRISSVM
jgi:hypothetical protein